MPTVNKVSLQKSVAEHKETFEQLKLEEDLSPKAAALIASLFGLNELLAAALIERKTPKTPRNSSLPPSSSDGADDTQPPARSRPGRKPVPEGGEPAAAGPQCDNLRTTVHTHTVQVDECGKCGRDLAATPCDETERRVRIDLVFETVEERVDAEARPARTAGTGPRAGSPTACTGPCSTDPGSRPSP